MQGHYNGDGENDGVCDDYVQDDLVGNNGNVNDIDHDDDEYEEDENDEHGYEDEKDDGYEEFLSFQVDETEIDVLEGQREKHQDVRDIWRQETKEKEEKYLIIIRNIICMVMSLPKVPY